MDYNGIYHYISMAMYGYLNTFPPTNKFSSWQLLQDVSHKPVRLLWRKNSKKKLVLTFNAFQYLTIIVNDHQVVEKL